jgi:hypothetical protein
MSMCISHITHLSILNAINKRFVKRNDCIRQNTKLFVSRPLFLCQYKSKTQEHNNGHLDRFFVEMSSTSCFMLQLSQPVAYFFGADGCLRSSRAFKS